MIKNIEHKKFKDLEDGDIFYLEVDTRKNSKFLGDKIDQVLAGNDMIFIMDSFLDSTPTYQTILVNGGGHLTAKLASDVLVLGHYSEINQHSNIV